ncbi:MAG: S8 family serine peptidase [Candidatus Limnocylindria bacterium]
MSRATPIILALAVMLTAALPVAAEEPKAENPAGDTAPATTPPAEMIPGEVIVAFRETDAEAAAESLGLAVVDELGTPDKGLPALVSTEGRPVEEVVAELKADPSVESVEPNYRIHLANEDVGAVAAVGVNDPKSGDQYSLDQMRVRDAWSLSPGGSNVIAVLDTGVQFDHPDLAGRLLTGYDFVNNDTNASDDNGHGTWVSGIIAANPNDGYGIAGISWNDLILPVKIMNGEGTGSTADLMAAIFWSADQGADVINMSVGGFPWSQLMQDAVNYAWNNGAVLVGAAGNNRREENFYPASFDNVISVTATQVQDEFSNWSSWGPKVDVSAPGASVLTTNCYTCTYADHDSWGSHTYISGTSFATPNVAGVIGLMRGRFPTYTPDQIVNLLFATVDDLGYPGWDNRYGRGRVNAYRALGAAVGGPGPTRGDAVEPNNTLASAHAIALNRAISPSLHPAGDVDVYALDLPSPGRLEVRVTGVVDTRAYPWNKSGLPVDPIVELYNIAGGLLQRVDNEWESGVEVASANVSGATRILVRISNWYPNGNRTAYAITPTFVDANPPAITSQAPGPGAINVSHDGTSILVGFSEDVVGVNGSTFQLRTAGGVLLPASVSYGSARATLTPTGPLAGEAAYTVSIGPGIADGVGNPVAPTSWSFTTGKAIARLAGADRFATAAAISASTFQAGAAVAYVATGATFPDALAGGPAAKVGGGPLLLTGTNSIPAATAAELARLRPGRIVVLGGTGAVTEATLNQLGRYTSGGVYRLAGADRYGTAAAISRAVFARNPSVVYVATGADYPDALAAGTAAANANAPVLLVTANAVPASTASELDRLRPSKIVVVGNYAAVTDAVVARLGAFAPSVQRIGGSDRYETPVALSQAIHSANSVSHAFIATADAFPDGLAVGPVAGLLGGPLLLVNMNGLPMNVAEELRRLDPADIVIVGGPAAVSDAVRAQIRALWP